MTPLDAIVAAPKNYKVLYEDDHVRVLEVTVQPGEIENMHHQAFEGGCFNHFSRLLESPDPRLFGALLSSRRLEL
jgi:hypothetical protein